MHRIALVVAVACLSLPASSSASACDRHVAPFFQGTGGFVGKPSNGLSVDVTIASDTESFSDTLYAREPDGLIVQLLSSSLCLDDNDEPAECLVAFNGLEDGGWYWVNGKRNAAVAPLLCDDQFDTDLEPFDPGGVDTIRSAYGTGTLFLHHTQNLMGIIPHVLDPDITASRTTFTVRGNGNRNKDLPQALTDGSYRVVAEYDGISIWVESYSCGLERLDTGPQVLTVGSGLFDKICPGDAYLDPIGLDGNWSVTFEKL